MMQHNEKGTRRDLVFYRLETAKSDIKSAEILLEAGEYRGANNRAYYGIYHAVSAIHALDGNAYKRHKDALANFNKNYIKTEIFPRILGRKIAEAEEIRHASDYDDFYIATKEEAREQIDTAIELIRKIEEYIQEKITVL
nr:HEPN domain-containing protein [uncultured Sellimonas sp.]